MERFWTEKETEAYLVLQTRNLPMPDGSSLPFTAFRLIWLHFEDLIRLLGYTPERIVELAVQETQATGVDFQTAFPAVVAYMESHLLRRPAP